MNTTFTNCAEKKANQFLNLLQGYTKGIRITAILILLLMGVSNAWGAQYNLNWQGKVYFLVPEKWDLSTYNYVQVDITRTQSNTDSKHQEYVGNMTRIGDSRLYYLDLSADHSSWKQNEYLAFTANDHYYGSGTFNLNNNALRTKPIDYGCNNSSNFYLFKPNSESNFNTTTNDNTMSGEWSDSRDNLLKKEQTIDLYLGDTKSDTGGSIEMQGYYFTSNTVIASSSVTSSSSSVSYDAVVGTEMTLKATENSGYNFVGWYNEGTLLSSEEEYTYCVYGTKTITARFEQEVVEPSITISTTQQYLQIGEDKLTLTINYTNIPEGHCYRVKVGDGYYNGNASGENNDHVSISGNGSVAFTTYSTLPGGTQSIVVELWKSNPFGATSTKSNAINVTVEQGYQVSVYTRIGSTNTPTGTTISPTEHIGKTITATEMPGYAFTGWTANTDNITFKDNSASPTLVYAKSGGDIYANYTKENCVYFVNTSNWNSVYAYAWNGGGEQKNAEWPGVAMTKTDEKIDGHDVYKYCEPYEKIIFNNNSSNQTGDIIWEDGVTYYPNSGLIKMHGNFTGDWNTTEAFAFSKDGKTATLTLSINNAKTYNFGMRIGKDDNWTSNGSSFSRADNSNEITGNSGNCSFDADVTGEYTFTWTFATNTLTITYPQLVTYTVTFDMKGHGDEITAQEITNGGKATTPTAPTATGYTFGGWYKDANCNTVWNFNTDVVTANTTLYAKWTPTTYKITYHLNGGEGAANSTYTIESDNITLPTPTRIGYTFVGWYENAEFTGNAVSQITKGSTGDKTLYAEWVERNLYIHTDFVDNWGTPKPMTQDVNNKAVYTYTTTLEAKAGSQASPYNDGYHFRVMNAQNGDNQYLAYNWLYVQTPTGTNIDGPHLTHADNPTIQFGLARKSEVTITLTLQSSNDNPKPTVEINANPYYTITRTNPINGNYTIKVGTNEAVSTNTESFADKTITLSATPNSGYHFVGWTVTKAGGGTVSVTDNEFTMPAEVITIAATFAATSYNITYHLNGGTGAANSTYTVESAAITLPTPTKTGYTFGGWFDNENCTGSAITTIAASSTGDKTFYAKWTANTYTVTLDQTDAETQGVRSIEVTYDTEMPSIAEQLPKRTGYHFGGYFTEKNGSGTQYYNQEGTAYYNKTWDKTSNTQLYIKWIANNYTVKFNANGGAGTMENQKFTYDTEQALNANTFTRTGYTFAGWKTNPTSGDSYSDKEVVKNLNSTKNGEITIYAQWTANTYTVTLDQTGATTQGTSSVTATYDADMPSATMPTKTGYVFGGYYDQQNGQGTQYYNANGASARTWNKAENTTLYAYFVRPQIEVTLNASTFKPGTASVTATATVTPAPADGTTSICWSLLYSGSENKVAGHEPTPTNGNSVQFSIGDLVAGSYTIKAILREGTGCEGTEISSATQTFLITSSHTITIKYTCDGKEIQASTTQQAQVSSATTITAPDILGYTFSKWEAGDGVTINGNTSNKTITYTAIYDGYLTAKYNVNNNIVYFKNTLGWNKVYVYTFSDNAWWDDNTGVHPATNKLEQSEMIRIGETDIYYFALSNPDGDYTQENNANKNYIAFSNIDYRNDNGAFASGQAIYRGDFKKRLTLFVPQKDQTPETYNNTKYYSKGIWMEYNSTESGYQIAREVPNDDPEHDGWGTWGNKFTAQQPGNYIFSITKHLDANKTYKFKIKNAVWVKDYNNTDNNQWFGNSGTMTFDNCTGWHFKGDNDEGKNNGDAHITTSTAGEYKFIIDLSQGKVLLSVEYPIAVGDYRVIYKDNATWSQGTIAHDENWYHPSRIIKKNKTNEPTKDIISFFISHGNNPTMKFQKVQSITNGNVTWEEAGNASIPNNITTPGVYNFVIIQEENGKSISMENNAEPYTGNYYIRCDAVGGQWDNYKTNKENRMTYSAFSEKRETNSFGELFSHYVTKYCPHSTNIKFTVANDYSPCISDTLVLDYGANNTTNPFGNLENDGTLKKDGGNNDKYSANVRFMWNRNTNKISRAYIGRAVTNDFLVITGDKQLQKSDGKTLRDTIVFFDKQNWIYEVKMKVQPTTRVKVYAAYPAGVGESKAQYFCGAYNNDTFNNDEDSKLALGGSANDKDYYSIRVLYDFKTNRLLMAWMPSGDTENVDGTKTISADVMLIRDHQNPAQCITFADANSKLTDVKTVYGVMRFNRWILNNRANPKDLDVDHCSTFNGTDRNYNEEKVKEYHPVLPLIEQKSIYERSLYFISFPFDVNLSDVFGFGTYWNEWYIEYYDGLKRAREGFFIDSPPNWKYVTPEMADTFKLRAYQGYILGLDLDYMQYDNTSFWTHNMQEVELFFPSTTTMGEIAKTEVTMPALGPEYECKINRPNSDHRVIDSYWRCIGVPSYANYSNVLTDDKQQTITWQTSYTTFPFLYAWNMTDNTLTPQSTTKFNFKTMHAYLVQNGGKIHWSAVSATPNQPSNIVARRQAADEVKNYEWKLTLSRNEQIEDQAFVRLSDDEQVTTEFDFNQDLSKEFNYGRSDIYTLIGYEKAAANSLPFSEQTTLIPLGLSIEYNGDYTIAMPGRMENIGVTLIDTESNTRTNLSAGMEYTLTLNKGDYNNRFFIEISPIQQTPTNIEYVTGDSNSQDSVRKVLIDNILYIVRDGQIFDARGARVK